MLPKVDRWTRWADLPEFLTVAEVQEYLRIGRTTAYDLIGAGIIKHIRLGRRILIPKSCLPRGTDNTLQ